MEEKIEGILARLSSGDNSNSVFTTSRMITPAPSSPDPLARDATFQIPFKIPSFQFSNIVFDGFQDVISKGYVTFEQVEMSVRAFQAQAFNFPFVLVEPSLGLDILRRKRSFLLISILTFAADQNPALQSKLETELKDTLAKRVIVSGEKSLDLLQGLLVYLNWSALPLQSCEW